MKHIFVVHSGITFMSTLGVIMKEKIDFNEVIILKDRNYIIDESYNFNILDISHLSNLFKGINVSSVCKLPSKIRLIDNYIFENICEESYVMYIPQVQSMFYQVLITNKFCINYNFIEEGLANYKCFLYSNPSVNLSATQQLLKFLFNKFSRRVMVYPNFLGVYDKLIVNPKYYLFSDKINIKDLNIVKIDFFNNNIKDVCLDKSAFFVCSPLVEMKILNLSEFMKLLDLIKNKFLQHSIRSFYIKFHPSQNNEIKELIIECFKLFNIKILEDDFSIEQLVLNRSDISIFGIESSVLYYSKILNKNCHVYSFVEDLYKFDTSYINKKNEDVIINLFKDIGIIML